MKRVGVALNLLSAIVVFVMAFAFGSLVDGPWQAVVVVALLLLLFNNGMLMLQFAKWRSINSTDFQLAPTDLMDTVEAQKSSFQQLASGIHKEGERSRTAATELLQAFTTLQTALNEKDAEIKRLKKGYDEEIFRRFLRRFIKLDKSFKEEISDHPSDDEQGRRTLKQLQIELGFALEECGVSKFSPKIGSNFRTAWGVDDDCEKRSAETSEQEYTIAEVLESGLKIDAPDGPSCLKEARVVVFFPAQEVRNG